MQPFQPPPSKQQQQLLEQEALNDCKWQDHEFQRYLDAGNRSLKEGKTAVALQFFDEALKFRRDWFAVLGKAKCLISEQRLPEAIEALRLIGPLAADCADLIVDCQVKLKDYAGALATCDMARQGFYPESNSFLLRSKVYLARGKSAEAIQCLTEGYYHCVRYGAPKREIIDALKALGSKPPSVIPEVTSGNEQVFSAIDTLARLDKPINERELPALFHIDLQPSQFAGPNVGISDWSVSNRLDPLEQLSLYRERGQDIRIRVNRDLTSITRGDLALRYGTLLTFAEFNKRRPAGWNNTSVDGAQAGYLLCQGGNLVFQFANSNHAHLEWVVRRFDAPGSERLPSESLEEHFRAVEELLENRQYDSASGELFKHWQDCYATHESPAAMQKILLQKKALLIEAQHGNPDVQGYLRAACLAYIGEDVDKINRFGGGLPTLEEFRSHRWHQTGSVLAPCSEGGYYVVWADSYSGIFVPQSSMLFRELYVLLGVRCVAGQTPLTLPIKPAKLDQAELLSQELFAGQK